MGLFPSHDRAGEDHEIDHPDDGQPKIDIPFGLCIFAGLGDAEDVAGGGEHDEDLVAPEQERGECRAAEKRRTAGALNHVKRRGDQGVAAEREDRGRGMNRAKAAEGGIFQAEIEDWKGQLEGDEGTHQEGHDAPKGRGDHEPADDLFIVGGSAAGLDLGLVILGRFDPACRHAVLRSLGGLFRIAA